MMLYIIPWPWNLAYRSLKVIESCAIRKLGCGFLFAFHSNYGAILYRLRDIVTYWYKIATPPVFSTPEGVNPVRILGRCLMLMKLEWLGYSMVKKLWQYVKPFSSNTGTLWTDRIPLSISRVGVRTRDKNSDSVGMRLVRFGSKKRGLVWIL